MRFSRFSNCPQQYICTLSRNMRLVIILVFYLAMDSTHGENYFMKVFNAIEKFFSYELEQIAKLISDGGSDLNTKMMVTSEGYDFLEYFVTTSDGYILAVHRVRSKATVSSENAPVVLLIHGIYASSTDFFMEGRNKSLGFILADSGIDVWLINTRGNKYSRKHIKLDPNDREFWRFSLDESIEYDLPSTIELILSTTKRRKIHVGGNSQGGTIIMMLCAAMKEYNDKFLSAHLISPTIYFSNIETPLFYLLYYGDCMVQPAKVITDEPREVYSYTLFKSNRQLINLTCNAHSPTRSLCEQFMYVLHGRSEGNLNETLISMYLGQTFAGGSYWQLRQYLQFFQSKSVTKYDFGAEKNKLKYGSERPPAYNLDFFTAPAVLYYGGNDHLASVKDMEDLAKDIVNLRKVYYVDEYNHFDFLHGISLINRTGKFMIEAIEEFDDQSSI